jgi:hypothetical protein
MYLESTRRAIMIQPIPKLNQDVEDGSRETTKLPDNYDTRRPF